MRDLNVLRSFQRALSRWLRVQCGGWLAAAVVTLSAVAGSPAWAGGPYWGSVDSLQDAVDGDATVPCFGEIRMRGWAANAGGSGVRTSAATDCSPWATAACGVKVYRESVGDVSFLEYQRLQLNTPRPDVEAAYGRADFRPSGYTVYANAGCLVGTRRYLGAADWDAFGPYLLAGSGLLNVVLNDKVDRPGIVSQLDQTNLWKASGTTTFRGDTTGYLNHYTKTNQVFWDLCTAATGKDAVWRFRLRVPTAVTLQTTGSSFDTVLYVIRSDNVSKGCNDDFGGLQSRLDLVLEPGDYYVFLDGYSAASQGAYRLDFSWSVL